jgi:putative SOS response-associated peptidase YedK
MCFHSKQTKKALEIENRFNAKFENKKGFEPTNHYNGFSFPKTPIITNENTSKIQMVNWGLLPNWASADFDKNNTLNARIESLTQKKSFKDITQNRCIVLVNGFYEWQHVGCQKIKYEIGINDELFAFAGLYDSNNESKTYTILTTEAKGIMIDIHNTKLRMPFALKTDMDFENWLSGGIVNPFYDFTTSPKLYKQHLLF